MVRIRDKVSVGRGSTLQYYLVSSRTVTFVPINNASVDNRLVQLSLLCSLGQSMF